MDNKDTSKKNLNNINIIDIAKLVSQTALNCYGVVSILKKTSSFAITTFKKLSDDNAYHGVEIKKDLNGKISVSIYINIAHGVKISEVLSECQKVIIFTLDRKYGSSFCKHVNIFAEGVSEK